MYDLTIIKQDGGMYIDSRDVAEAIGKRHDNLLRDIAGYLKIMRKTNALKIEDVSFFAESTYQDIKGEIRPRYLISKMGAEVIAHKLTGEKGLLFTTVYVTKFNEMEAAEREAEIKAYARPRLGEFNSAVKNILGGMSYALSAPSKVMKFLRGVYEPLGIEVNTEGDYYGYFSATEIASLLGIYSSTNRPHGHAVSAIISKIENYGLHTMMIPYGLVGVTFRYDNYILEGVRDWIADNNNPSEVPHQGFNYHIYYAWQPSLFDYDKEVFYE